MVWIVRDSNDGSIFGVFDTWEKADACAASYGRYGAYVCEWPVL